MLISPYNLRINMAHTYSRKNRIYKNAPGANPFFGKNLGFRVALIGIVCLIVYFSLGGSG